MLYGKAIRFNSPLVFVILLTLGQQTHGASNVRLQSPSSHAGYVARLLINEAAFPGEKGYVSEKNSKAAMLQILWVLHCRIEHIPKGYNQTEIATVRTTSILDVITAGGVKGQVDGFYRDSKRQLRMVPRVHKRVNYLVLIGNQGKAGRVARLLNHAQSLASRYFSSGPNGHNLFKNIQRIYSTRVTGRAYSWMTNRRIHSPGGRYVTIPNKMRGALGGNRFFTLKAK